ncbi:ArsC/Spx/MgsR family protein [Flavobacterium sp.]|uniref:ArsC/Spx/MgsR family protein n=1 Tax=Flavobacterium sp. TaxID=239 RepID=UPI0025D63835|nr:ArsC/Spx/MgsR family protein [Flavobacterium sp.]
MLQILHNPRCGKSRNCLVFLNDANIQFEIIDYIKNPLTALEIKTMLKKLNLKPLELVRQKETIWIDNYKGKLLNDEAIISAIATYPILMERPIIIDGEEAIIGREAVKIKDFLTNN